MTQFPATDVSPAQPWKRTQDQRQFEYTDVHAQETIAVKRDITGSSNMSMSVQPGDALILVESVKETSAILEETHFLSHIANRGR
jgi:hypothetical protein